MSASRVKPTSASTTRRLCRSSRVPERPDGAEEGVGEQGGRGDDQDGVAVLEVRAGEQERHHGGAPPDDEDRLGEGGERVGRRPQSGRPGSRGGVAADAGGHPTRSAAGRRRAGPRGSGEAARQRGRHPRSAVERPEAPWAIPGAFGQGRRQHEVRWLRHLRALLEVVEPLPPWETRSTTRSVRDTDPRTGSRTAHSHGDGHARLPSPGVVLIGLTGGIGSGKSTVSALLAERGAVVIDADAITRELQQPGTEVFVAMRERFGPGIVAAGRHPRPPGGGRHRLQRCRGAQGPRRHRPPGGGRGDRRAPRRAAQGTDQVVVLDVPLLVESGRDDMAALVVVDVDPGGRRSSASCSSEGCARTTPARAWRTRSSREDRLARADFVLDNSGSVEDLGSPGRRAVAAPRRTGVRRRR